MLLLHRVPQLRRTTRRAKVTAETPFAECFFDCLEGRVPDNGDGEEFIDYVEDVHEWVRR